MGCHQEHSALQTCPVCGFDPFVRNHYFTGKMMGAAEFGTETLYHSDKMRHHNVRLHGTGTVCGLKVVQHPSPDCQRRYVVVEPGSALDCCGREILVTEAEMVDVTGHPAVARLHGDGLAHALQLCIRYRDCPTEDVPVLYDECGCDDTQCAPNRILESFAFDVLVDPPLPDLGSTGLQATGALVATDAHGVTGFLKAGANGLLAVVDLGDATRLLLIDLQRRLQRQVVIGPAIRALALSADGTRAFVVTDSTVAAAEAEVHVLSTADGSEVAASAPGVLHVLPGTTAASVLRAVATSNPALALVVHERSSGTLHVFGADPVHGLVDAPTPVASAADLDAFTALPDGSSGFAIDGAANRVKKLDFGGAAPVDLDVLPAGAHAVALAAFLFDTKPQLAVGSDVDKRAYLVDLATTVAVPIDLAQAPESLGATGDGSTAGVWLHVLERDGSAWAEQSIALAPMATAGGVPLVAAARAVGAGPRQLVLVGDDDGAATLAVGTLAMGDCGDHVWQQLEGCPSCDSGDCVVLATLSPYRPGDAMRDLPAATDDTAQHIARIDNRDGRHILASTASLQAWLECLQTQGGVAGPPGPRGPAGADGTDGTDGTDGQAGKDGQDGLGFDPDQPKIIDIGWQHRSTLPYLDWVKRLYAVDLTQNGAPYTPDQVIAAVKSGQDVPLFTIYFNRVVEAVDRQTLRVKCDFPLLVVQDDVPLPTGIYSPFGHELYGNIIEVPGPVPTPHTGEQAAFAVVLQPLPAYLQYGPGLFAQSLANATRANVDGPSFTVSVKGDFIFAVDAGGHYSEGGVLDAENIGGRVGRNEVRPPPIKGGKNPSGNLAEGGLFEGWFFLKLSGDATGDANVPPLALPVAPAAPPAVDPNLASRETLAALPGMDRATVDRIAAARARKPFSGVADLRKRASLTDAAWQELRQHLLVL